MVRQANTVLLDAPGTLRTSGSKLGIWPGGLVITLFLLAGLVAPVLAALISILGIAALSLRPTVTGGVTVGVVALVLAWLNTGKGIQGDWAWYVLHYEVLVYAPLSEYLGVHFGVVAAKPTEPLYYALARLLAVTTDGNVEVLAAAVTLVIYGTLGAAIVTAISSFERKPWTVLVATVSGLLVGLTFTLSTQLVRQEIAAALIALAIVTSAKRKWLLTLLILIAAFLTHNSALIPAAGLVVATLIRRHGKNRVLGFFMSGAIFYALGRFYLATSGDAYGGKDDGFISLTVIAFDVAIVAVFLFLHRQGRFNGNIIASTVLMCLPVFYGFVLGVASQPIPLLRMYFYVEILRALMVVFICASLMRGRLRLLVGALFLTAAIAYLALRIHQSPFDYEGTLSNLMWTPLAAFLPGY